MTTTGHDDDNSDTQASDHPSRCTVQALERRYRNAHPGRPPRPSGTARIGGQRRCNLPGPRPDGGNALLPLEQGAALRIHIQRADCVASSAVSSVPYSRVDLSRSVSCLSNSSGIAANCGSSSRSAIRSRTGSTPGRRYLRPAPYNAAARCARLALGVPINVPSGPIAHSTCDPGANSSACTISAGRVI